MKIQVLSICDRLTPAEMQVRRGSSKVICVGGLCDASDAATPLMLVSRDSETGTWVLYDCALTFFSWNILGSIETAAPWFDNAATPPATTIAGV